MVPPGEFIPARRGQRADRADRRLGRRHRDRPGRRWRAQGLRPDIAFNVSPRSCAAGLRRPPARALRRRTARPDAVHRSRSPSRRRWRPEYTVPLLERLAAAGLRLAIDDFGADYSSLARLRDLPVHELKIDRSFLRGVPGDGRRGGDRGGGRAARQALELTAVAEGVEHADTARLPRPPRLHAGAGLPPRAPDAGRAGDAAASARSPVRRLVTVNDASGGPASLAGRGRLPHVLTSHSAAAAVGDDPSRRAARRLRPRARRTEHALVVPRRREASRASRRHTREARPANASKDRHRPAYEVRASASAIQRGGWPAAIRSRAGSAKRAGSFCGAVEGDLGEPVIDPRVGPAAESCAR